MFKIKIGEDEYRLSFHHSIPRIDYKDRAELYKKKKKEFNMDYGTTCTIIRVKMLGTNLEYSWVHGFSDLSIKDVYCRRTGREIAFKRAIKQLPSDIGDTLLDYYMETRNGKW